MNRNTRNYLFQYMDVFDQHTHEHLGFLVDVSKSGLMIIAQRRLPPGQTRDVYIRTATGDGKETQPPVNMQITVVWNRPNINPELTCVGCKVFAVNPVDEQRLLAVAKSLSFDPGITLCRVKHDTEGA